MIAEVLDELFWRVQSSERVAWNLGEVLSTQTALTMLQARSG
jgi:hypothetical protein